MCCQAAKHVHCCLRIFRAPELTTSGWQGPEPPRVSFFAIVHSTHAAADRMSGGARRKRETSSSPLPSSDCIKSFSVFGFWVRTPQNMGSWARKTEREREGRFSFYPSVLQHVAQAEGTKCWVNLRVLRNMSHLCLRSWSARLASISFAWVLFQPSILNKNIEGSAENKRFLSLLKSTIVYFPPVLKIKYFFRHLTWILFFWFCIILLYEKSIYKSR